MGRRMRSRKHLAFLTLQLLLLHQVCHGFSLYPQQSQRQTPSLLYEKMQLHSEHDPVVDQRKYPSNNTSSSSDNTSPFPLLRTAVLVSAISLPCFLLAAAQTHAIDLPSVDSLHLQIPNPLPDADPRYFLSGGICAAASHGITTPVDVIKTRQQADPDLYTGGLVRVARTISKEEGPTALLGGLVPTIIGYGAEGKDLFVECTVQFFVFVFRIIIILSSHLISILRPYLCLSTKAESNLACTSR